jgi:hypothetical protein
LEVDWLPPDRHHWKEQIKNEICTIAIVAIMTASSECKENGQKYHIVESN